MGTYMYRHKMLGHVIISKGINLDRLVVSMTRPHYGITQLKAQLNKSPFGYAHCAQLV